MISQEQDSELISEKQKVKDNLTVSSIVAEKSWSRMEFKDCIKDSEFQSLVFSLTELSISEAMMLVRDSFGVTNNNKELHHSFQNSCSPKSSHLHQKLLLTHLIPLEED